MVGEVFEIVVDNNFLVVNRLWFIIDDVLVYLKVVKDKFKNDKIKYEEFLEVIKDFKV